MTTNNIKEVEISIKRMLDSLVQSPSDPCIRKVPESYAKLSKCYEPSIVSIGPIHYNTKPALKSFHEMKVRHLQCFLEAGNKNYGLDEYIGIVKKQEDLIRSYYAEKSSLSSNEFIEMVLLDATFIIIFFLFCTECEIPIGRHPMIERFEVLLMVKQDIFMVENQLPFFMLNDLYYKAFGEAYQNTTFVDVTCSFLRGLFSVVRDFVDTITIKERIRNAPNVKHLVDLVRICCLPTKLRDQNDPNYLLKTEYPKSTVKELKAAGVKFRANESQNLLDIVFSKGVLQIPKLRVHDSTEHTLRNIVFLEQCHHSHDSYMIDYIAFMDELIDTAEDVQILVQNGIMENCLGSDEEVATLFNQICKGVIINDPQFYYGQQSKELNAYVDTKWNKWKAVLKREYFNHPWSIMSIIYLVLLLILTILQVYTGFKGL